MLFVIREACLAVKGKRGLEPASQRSVYPSQSARTEPSFPPSRPRPVVRRSVGRFLHEVFPREARQQPAGRGGQGTSAGGRSGSRGRRSGSWLPAPRYGSAFRRLYGHAAYSFAAFVLRICGGSMLKGLPLRELVEAFFEGVAGVGVEASGASAPHAELTALAVKHVPDLLHGFSEVCAEGSLWQVSFFFRLVFFLLLSTVG